MKHTSSTRHLRKGGFSLVEVTLAIGIVSFALLAVVALLPAGLKSIKSANEQAGAANTLAAISTSLRNAQQTNNNFAWSFAEQSNSFTLGGPAPNALVWTNLNLEGNIAQIGDAPRLSARVEIKKTPGTNYTPGEAVITVAWSAQSNPQWNATNQQWSNADGSITSGIQFLPRP